MGCEQWREALSAQLDGEETVAERGGIDAHLAGCADCRHWLDQAAMVTRLARTSLVNDVPDPAGTPDLVGAVLAASPVDGPVAVRGGTWRGRLATPLRAALGLLGAVQFVLGLAQIGGGASTTHTHAAATPGHLWHESVAWNVAVGIGFIFIAARRSRPTGLLPTLTVFVVMLVLLSVNDLVAAMVEPARLVGHGFIVAGYLIIVALSRPSLDPGWPPTGQRPEQPAWRVRFPVVDGAAPASSRLVRNHPVTVRVGRLASGGPERALPGRRSAQPVPSQPVPGHRRAA